MSRNTIILFIIILVCRSYSYGQTQLSVQQKSAIESNVISLLNSLEKYLNLELKTENEMNNLRELEKMFDKNAAICNFLDPLASRSDHVSPKHFVEYIDSNYTGGLSAKLTWDIQKTVFSEFQDFPVQSVYIPVKIMALGIHRSQKIINVLNYYFFVFEYKISDDEISDLKIIAILHKRPLKISKSPNNVGFYINPLNSYIYSKNIFSNNDWDATGRFGYQLGLHFNHQLNNHFSIFTGIGFSKFQSAYELTVSDNRDIISVKREDKDGDEYYAFYSKTLIDEWSSLSYFDVPIGMNYISNAKGWGFFIQAGFNLSFMISSYFDAEGSATIEGYYPKYSVVLNDLPDYDYTTNTVDTTNDWNLNQFSLSGFISMGVQIPAGDRFLIRTGPFFTTGLTDLVYDKVKHRDDYLNISGDPGKLTTRGFGLKLELIMKF